jgi:4-amino-4-deoxy-L-arabinose transferase-like glycosyltransferase
LSPRLRWLLALCAIGVHLTLLFVYWFPEPKQLAGDENNYLEAGARILQGQPADLDLLWPPLYPHLLAWVWSLGGDVWTVQLGQTLLLCAVAWLWRDLTLRVVGSGLAADWVAFGLLAYPPLVAFAHYLWPEVPHLFLATCAAWIVARDRGSITWMIALGVCLGLAMLMKTLLLFFVPVLLIPSVAREGFRLRGWIRAGVAMGVATLVVLPVVARNWREHRLPVVAEPVLFNLWVGLNDRAPGSVDVPTVIPEYNAYVASSRDSLERRRVLAARIQALLRERGPWLLAERAWIQYRRLFHRDSFLTDQLPGGEMRQQYQGTPSWLTGAIRLVCYGSYAALLVLAVAGVASVSSWPGWLRIALAFIAYNLAIFLLLHVKTRYRLQMVPVLLLFAGLFVERVWRARGIGGLFSRGRALSAAAIALLLLGLAFVD